MSTFIVNVPTVTVHFQTNDGVQGSLTGDPQGVEAQLDEIADLRLINRGDSFGWHQRPVASAGVVNPVLMPPGYKPVAVNPPPIPIANRRNPSGQKPLGRLSTFEEPVEPQPVVNANNAGRGQGGKLATPTANAGQRTAAGKQRPLNKPHTFAD
jgi:hypothetical protein